MLFVACRLYIRQCTHGTTPPQHRATCTKWNNIDLRGVLTSITVISTFRRVFWQNPKYFGVCCLCSMKVTLSFHGTIEGAQCVPAYVLVSDRKCGLRTIDRVPFHKMSTPSGVVMTSLQMTSNRHYVSIKGRPITGVGYSRTHNEGRMTSQNAQNALFGNSSRRFCATQVPTSIWWRDRARIGEPFSQVLKNVNISPYGKTHRRDNCR